MVDKVTYVQTQISCVARQKRIRKRTVLSLRRCGAAWQQTTTNERFATRKARQREQTTNINQHNNTLMARGGRQSSQQSQQSGSTGGLPSERHEEMDDGSSIASTGLPSAVTPHRADMGATSVIQPSKKPWTGDSTDIDNVVPVLNNYITTCLFPKVKFLKSDDPLLSFKPQDRSLCRMVSWLHCCANESFPEILSLNIKLAFQSSI